MANKRDKDSLQIFARVRGLMPWEPKKVSLKVVGSTVQNKAGKVINSYDFKRVFKPESTNEQCFKTIALPMISNVLKGFNAVLIAYGQTGSGKTYSMLGKPKLGIVGMLPRMLEYMVKQKQVQKVELAAVEAFGHHVAKVFLFDLYDPDNQVADWSLKKGDTGLDMHKARSVNIADAQDAHDKIIYAHAASHFAPTGKNPESSRGHVSFIATIHQQTGAHESQVSYFIMVDCAGSEGETAFTPEFRAAVSPQVLLCRRLEAGTINTGLSQLQVIFSELRTKGQITKTVGIGLRRVLHPFINTKTYLSVLFTLSPSVNNAKATESTLKFAVTAGMVKVKPIQTKGKVNFKTLVAELKAHIEQQEQMIDMNNTKIEALRRQQNRTTLAIEQGSNRGGGGGAGGDQVAQTRTVKKRKQVVNDDGEVEYVEYDEEETYYVDAKDAKKGGVVGLVGAAPNLDHLNEHKAAELDEESQTALMDVLDDISKNLDNELSDDFKKMVASQRLQSDKHGIQALQTITQEDNEEAMRLALEQYAKLTAPWQKEAFIKKKKAEIAKRKSKAEDAKLKKSASQGLLMIDEQLQQAQNDYKRLQEKQKDLSKKLANPNYAPQREMLTEHAMELNIMLANQEAVTNGLLQSKQIIMEYLKEDGREALIQFFKMRVMKK
mmetsp:Transcript_26625/g.43582  ORF Transcript_26625/g.43582 Transcript_26625/m.43582 type:complete len:663 (+) Transcript_26625:138-2126(+)